MSVAYFYCFLWVKIVWDINLNFFFLIFLYVCVCVSVCKHTHTKWMYTYALAYIVLFAKMVAEEDTLFFFFY